MTCPNDRPSDLAGCSDVEKATVNQTFKGLDVRVAFRDGGVCENQTIRWLRIERNGSSVYFCSNIVGFSEQLCGSNEKFQVVIEPQCEFINSQYCKYRIFLNFTEFDASDVGRYVATVQVLEAGFMRRNMAKIFDLFFDGTCRSPV